LVIGDHTKRDSRERGGYQEGKQSGRERMRDRENEIQGENERETERERGRAERERVRVMRFKTALVYSFHFLENGYMGLTPEDDISQGQCA